MPLLLRLLLLVLAGASVLTARVLNRRLLGTFAPVHARPPQLRARCQLPYTGWEGVPTPTRGGQRPAATSLPASQRL